MLKLRDSWFRGKSGIEFQMESASQVRLLQYAARELIQDQMAELLWSRSNSQTADCQCLRDADKSATLGRRTQVRQ
jgi:hypothetical protein